MERAGHLDSRMRRWVQDPKKILGPYIKKGMAVLDIGCGPGFFSVDMALMVGESGRVIAADIQEGMLRKLKHKIQGTDLDNRIMLHKCGENQIGVREHVDFVLAFYVLHEVPDQLKYLDEIRSILKPGGQVLLVEPPLHVSKQAFEKMIANAEKSGFDLVKRPGVFLSKAALLRAVTD